MGLSAVGVMVGLGQGRGVAAGYVASGVVLTVCSQEARTEGGRFRASGLEGMRNIFETSQRR